MRVLFVMHYPGYLRYFDRVVEGLVENGHRVDLAFGSLTRQAEGLEAAERIREHTTVVGVPPQRPGRWAAVADAIGRTADDLRYMHPRYSGSLALRVRRQPPPIRLQRRIKTLPAAVVDAAVRLLLRLDALIPSGEEVERFLREHDPDVLVVSPLVLDAKHQAELVRSAEALDIPVVLAVASWDHLSTKRLIRPLPDVVLVWNEVQRREAIEIHHVPPDRVVVTGAQPFDRWFERRPRRSREEFLEMVGLPPDAALITFVGSTATISPGEAEKRFVADWISALRSSTEPGVGNAGLLIRPHPYNAHWDGADLPRLPRVALWPPDGANPVDEDDRDLYFDSLHHSDAVVGINTSAMVEAAVIGVPVLSVLVPDFHAGQIDTLHFRYLLPENGGFLTVARSLPEHVDQLAEAVSGAGPARARSASFVDSFVRPLGREEPATPVVVDAIERAAT